MDKDISLLEQMIKFYKEGVESKIINEFDFSIGLREIQAIEHLVEKYTRPCEEMSISERKEDNYKLCYIDGNKAWFTSNFKEQWRR